MAKPIDKATLDLWRQTERDLLAFAEEMCRPLPPRRPLWRRLLRRG